ncbi:MAG: hypothetical protein A4S09_05960 [Proteobacteria bacterium SG_bin7]|nr:MAG: hypothetical protein A4S09_05960 [Proteobacteria bacterium SG_bin7]
MKRFFSYLIIFLSVSSAFAEPKEIRAKGELKRDDQSTLKILKNFALARRFEILKNPNLRPAWRAAVVESIVSDGFSSYEKSHGPRLIISVDEFEKEFLKMSGGEAKLNMADFNEYLSKDKAFIGSEKGVADSIAEIKKFESNLRNSFAADGFKEFARAGLSKTLPDERITFYRTSYKQLRHGEEQIREAVREAQQSR